MKESGTGGSGAVVAGTDERPKRRWLLLALVLVVLLAGGAGSYLVSHKKRPPAAKAQTSQQQVQVAVDKSYADSDYAGAAKTLESQPGAKDPQAQFEIATAYTNAKDYQKALQIYADLDKAGKLTWGMAAAAAEVAETTNDSRLALKYYKQAKDLASAAANHDRLESRIKRYDAKIAELEKKQ